MIKYLAKLKKIEDKSFIEWGWILSDVMPVEDAIISNIAIVLYLPTTKTAFTIKKYIYHNFVLNFSKD